jgi:hypothetical protein
MTGSFFVVRPMIGMPVPETRREAEPELRQALKVISQHVDDYISRARLGKAA